MKCSKKELIRRSGEDFLFLRTEEGHRVCSIGYLEVAEELWVIKMQ
jgi:hypothetical protein